VAIAGIFTMSGGMVTLTLAHYTSLHIPWEPLALVLTAGAIGSQRRPAIRGAASRERSTYRSRSASLTPILGALTLIVPFVELCKPGQPVPYSEFPYIALAVLAVAIATACITVHRHSSTGLGEGTTFSEPSASG
jgi:hypothetical protein